MQDLVCSECGNGFARPGSRGPVPARCLDCKTERRRARHAAKERDRLERRRRSEYRCGRCRAVKPGTEFAPSQLRDGGWCRQCFRDTYVERSGGTETRTCATCSSEFSATRRSRRKYCSRSCKDRAFQVTSTERNRDAKRGRPCLHCGEEIPVERQRSARYCSEDCYRAHARPVNVRRSRLKTKYGMTLEQYEALITAQGDACAICGTTDPGAKGVWYVDHCHNSSAVRGLLCSPCNTGLGHFKDNTELLARAIDYLNRGTLNP